MSNLRDSKTTFDDSDNAPESLLHQCFVCIVRDLSIISFINPKTSYYELYPNLAFPREICEQLVDFYCKNTGSLDDKFINLFKDTAITSLKRICVRNCSISDRGLSVLLRHKLVELNMEKCKNLTENSLYYLNQNGENLQCLTIGSGVKLLQSTLHSGNAMTFSNKRCSDSILNTPKLRRLTIRSLMFGQKEQTYFTSLFQNLCNLTHLDLSGCVEIEHFSFLMLLKNLVYLVLHNIVKVQDGLVFIFDLKNLRHLDISQSGKEVRTFQNENEILAEIVKNLPNLVSLDISGTNLAGTGVARTKFLSEEMCDIPGLNSRMSNKLEFLGLYGCQDAPCRRHDVPAKQISGDANEAQILTAARAYVDRPDVLQRVLNDLYHLFRYEHCHDVSRALSVVVDAMDRHLGEKHIQISGSATLFYIVKNKDIPPFSGKVKRMVISTLLNGMNAHKDDDTMMRNGCLTLCQFKIPQDVLFEYERLVLMLLHIVIDMEQEGFVQRIGIYLLNSLACQVDNIQKKLLGGLCAIDKMLKLIHDRVSRKICDDVLEVAWSAMWNVTDETAENCERFLDGGGMEYFLSCLQLFPDKEELMRNMMGLLGNVAEVQFLHYRLMVPKYIQVFLQLVNSRNDGIEVSYNAAGVLSHLASDGPEAWTISKPSRQEALDIMVAAIEKWELNTERNINYRSFEPILSLAKVRHTPQCQHWAVWALANLTRVYPDKYCSLVESEGGIEVLQQLIADTRPYQRIKELATLVLTHCEQFKTTGQVELEPPQLDG